MKTNQERAQAMELQDELQELYLLSKHWTSDISFAEDEIRFLKHMLEKYAAHTLTDMQRAKALEIKHGFSELDGDIPELKLQVETLLKFIDPLINRPDKEIGVDLIEKFFSLEKKIKALFLAVKEIKKSLFIVIGVELNEHNV